MVHPEEEMKPLPEFGVGVGANLGHRAESPNAGVGGHGEIPEPLTPILPRPAIHTAEMRVCHCVGSA
jgi:hypothetical protein